MERRRRNTSLIRPASSLPATSGGPESSFTTRGSEQSIESRNTTGGTTQQNRPGSVERRAQYAHAKMDEEMLAATSTEAPPLVQKLSKSNSAHARRGSGFLSVKTGQSNMTDATEKMTRNLSSITTIDTNDEGHFGADVFGDDVLAREIMNLRQNSEKSLDFDANEVIDEEEEEEEEESGVYEDRVRTDPQGSSLPANESQSSLNSSSSRSLQAHGITLTDAQRRLISARYQREKAMGQKTSSARSIAMAAAAESQGPTTVTNNTYKVQGQRSVSSIQQGLQQKGKSRRVSDRPAELRQQGKRPPSQQRSQSDAKLSGKGWNPNAKNAIRKYSHQEGGTVSTQSETVEMSKEDDTTAKQSSHSSSASPSKNLIDSPRVSANRGAEQDTATTGRTIDSDSHQATKQEVNVAAARIYIGKGISSDISVASSITESHAVVPGSLDVLTTASSIARGHHPSTNKNRKAGRLSEHSGSEEESINCTRVASWLSQQCLERYTGKFIENGYDSLDRVRYIDKSELKRMEILPGHQRSLYHAILALRRQRPQTNLELISEENLSENPSEEQTTVESGTIDAPPPSSHGSGAKSGSDTSGNRLQGQQQRRAPSRPRRAAQRLAPSSQGIAHSNSRKNLNSARHALRQDQDRIQRKMSSLKSNRRIGGGTGINSTTTTKKNQKKVRFSVAEVRTYERYYSDNPSVTAGPPVGIGWRHNPRLTVRFGAMTHSRARDERNVPTGFCPVLNRDQREQCLEDAGFSSKDIAAATRKAIKSKNGRRQTIQNLQDKERLEGIGRSIKNVIRL